MKTNPTPLAGERADDKLFGDGPIATGFPAGSALRAFFNIDRSLDSTPKIFLVKDLGMYEDMQISRIHVAVGENPVSGEKRETCGQGGLSRASLAAYYDELFHDIASLKPDPLLSISFRIFSNNSRKVRMY